MLKKRNKIIYAASHILSKPEKGGELVHAFLGRVGGVSPTPYYSLNIGRHTNDAPKNIDKNIDILNDAFALNRALLITTKQVHGKDVFVVEDNGPSGHKGMEADAIVTSLKGIAIGVLTADCVPVLIHDTASGVVAAVHAGWRGILKGVIDSTISVMVERFGTKTSNLSAAIGPSIRSCCYKVGAELEIKFKGMERCVTHKEDTPYVDLSRAVLLKLKEAGINERDISIEEVCTSCRNEMFFSYRADGSNGEDTDTGRQLSFIMIRG